MERVGHEDDTAVSPKNRLFLRHNPFIIIIIINTMLVPGLGTIEYVTIPWENVTYAPSSEHHPLFYL